MRLRLWCWAYGLGDSPMLNRRSKRPCRAMTVFAVDMPGTDIDLLHAARCEDLQYAQIKELSVGGFRTKDDQHLKGIGAHLLQGARGMGKSMVLRLPRFQCLSRLFPA